MFRKYLILVGIVSVAGLLWYASPLSHNKEPLTGDQPHYLVMSQSVLSDRGLDVKNQYQQRSYRDFYEHQPSGWMDYTGINNPLANYPAVIEPHVDTRFMPDGPHWYSYHAPGLSLLTAPMLWIGGLPLVQIGMVGCALAVLILTYVWTKRVTRKRWAAFLATGMTGFSVSFLSLSGLVYPDLPAALLLLTGLLIVTGKRLRIRWLLVLSIAAGLAPWLHARTYVVSLALLGYAGWVICKTQADPRRRAVRLGALALPAVALMAGALLLQHYMHGAWMPTGVYGKPSLFALDAVTGSVATLTDQTKGIFSNNPAYLLLIPGTVFWARKDLRSFFLTAIVVGPTLLLNATFRGWWGGFSPPGRYSFAIIPALAPAIAFCLLAAKRLRTKALIGTVAAFQAILVLGLLTRNLPTANLGDQSPVYYAVGAEGVAKTLFPRYTEEGVVNTPVLHVSWLLVLLGLLAAPALPTYRRHGRLFAKTSKATADTPLKG